MKAKYVSLLSFLLLLAVATNSQFLISSASAAQLFHNGKILTMAGKRAEYVEALVEDDGNIAFVGKFQDAKEKYPKATKIDLNEKTMLPGFIDAHSHIGMVADTMGQVDISSPPIGDVKNFDGIVQKLLQYQKENNTAKGEWIFAWGYDENQLEEKQHISKRELDKHFQDNPVYLQHSSGHMGVANSNALEILGVNAESINPKGGVIARFEGTKEPTGLVQEVAMYDFMRVVLGESASKKDALFGKAQDYYAQYGITTAQDGSTDPDNMAFFVRKAKNKELKIDVVSLAGTTEIRGSPYTFREYHDRLKFQGIKIVSDGSPQGKTAFFTKEYLTPVEGCEKDCRGFANINQDDLNELFVTGYKNNRQLWIHSNGDASIDTIIKAHEYACKTLNLALDSDRRTVVVHSQFIRPDQLETFKKYKLMPSFFTNHAFFWGDVHVENLGEDRAFFLSPIKAAEALGLTYTNHSDATVTPINPMFILWTAVNRVSRSGKVIGPDQRIDPYTALKGITKNAAIQIFDESIKGTLEVGKYADFVILENNPLDVEPMEIKDIKVLETIKQGTIVYKAK